MRDPYTLGYTRIHTHTQHSKTHWTQARDYGTQVGHTHPVLNPWVRWYASGAQACLILAEVISIVSVMHATSIAFDPCNSQTVSQLVSLPTPPTSEFALPNGMVLDVCHCMLHTLPVMIEPRVDGDHCPVEYLSRYQAESKALADPGLPLAA